MRVLFKKNWQSWTHLGARYAGDECELPDVLAKRAIRQGVAVKVENEPVVQMDALDLLSWNALRALARERTGQTPKNKAEALALLSNKSLGAAPENKSALV